MISDEAVEAAREALPLCIDADTMRAALEAAAPHIQAQALEDAATELDDKRLLSKPFHIFYPEWLCARANSLRNTK